MAGPTISVNVCTYNAQELLANALDCMTRQETDGKFSFEIVVVDDGSMDGTSQFIEEVAATAPVTVRHVDGEGRGVAHARNMGAAHSCGEWIAWFDQDQLTEPVWLKELYLTACETGADLVDGPRDLLLPREQLAGLNKFCRMCLGEIAEGDTVCKIVRRYGSCTGNALVKNHVFEAVGGFDESILDGWEDWDFIRKVRGKGFECWHTPKAIVHHVIAPHRLEPAFFRWHAARLGVAFASRDFREWGLAITVLACVARIGQALFANMPLLALAGVKGDSREMLTRTCLILRAVSYTRKTLFFLSPRLFPQRRFHTRLQLRNEPRGTSEDHNQ